MELVSIVVPVYKVEMWLERCVKSIQNQTYSNIEIILVDDGSPDRSGEMCDQFAEQDPRIKVIHKPNGGQGDARNLGVDSVTGKYLLFVDSDDYISEELVEKTVAVAEEYNCDMVLFDYNHVKDGEKEIRTNNVPANRIINLKEERRLLMIPPSPVIKLYNCEFYKKSNSAFPKGLYYEDLGMTLKILTDAERIYYLPEPFYYYMIRENSTMGSKNYERNYHDMELILKQVIEFYKEKNLYNEYRNELEYLTFLNLYFEPSKKMVLAKADKKYLMKTDKLMKEMFPEFIKNPYICKFGKKDKLHLWILNHKQYWLMRILSECRKRLKR